MRPRLPLRLALLSVLAATAGLLVYAGVVEPRRVELTRHTLGRPREGQAPLRVVQLSDLHLSAVGDREHRAAAQVRAERPDLLVLTGDLAETDEALPLLDELLSLVGDVPAVIAAPGNWEHWGCWRAETASARSAPHAPLRAVLARHRGRLLVNEVLLGERGGRRWAVAGLDYPAGALPRREAARLEGVANVLVLAHTPAARDRWSGPPAVAMLAGHTHGGQVAPFGHPLWLPAGCGDYAAGWFRGPPVDLYVSRGLGTSMLPLRLGARPEVASFEWWLE